MVSIDKNTLVLVLKEHEGVDLISYGKPRDGFELGCSVEHWTSGYGGKYEMVHNNVPPGVMIAVGDLENIEIKDQGALKAHLQKIDAYPTGHSGDFSGKDIAALKQWFFDRSVRDDATNNQDPLTNAKKPTPEGLGKDRVRRPGQLSGRQYEYVQGS